MEHRMCENNVCYRGLFLSFEPEATEEAAFYDVNLMDITDLRSSATIFNEISMIKENSNQELYFLLSRYSSFYLSSNKWCLLYYPEPK